MNDEFPSPLYAETPDQLTEAHLTHAFQEQLKASIITFLDALTYYSDSTVDPITSAADAINTLNWCYHNTDLEGFRTWLASTDDNGEQVHNYCSEGLSNWAYKQHEKFCEDCRDD